MLARQYVVNRINPIAQPAPLMLTLAVLNAIAQSDSLHEASRSTAQRPEIEVQPPPDRVFDGNRRCLNRFRSLGWLRVSFTLLSDA